MPTPRITMLAVLSNGEVINDQVRPTSDAYNTGIAHYSSCLMDNVLRTAKNSGTLVTSFTLIFSPEGE